MILRTKRWLDAACVAAAAILMAVVVHLTLEAREHELHSARADVANLTVALELYAHSTISTIDQSLLAARYALRVAGLDPNLNRAPAERAHGDTLLDDAVRRLERPVFMRVLDRGGRLVYSADRSRIGGDVSDRDYFRAHAEVADDAGLFISDLLISRITGRASIVFSRRLVDERGAFAGVILVGAPASVFEADFARLPIGGESVVMLADDDGTLIVRRPAAAERIGLQLAPSVLEVLSALTKTTAATEIHPAPGPDGVLRLYGFRRVGDTHFVVGVGHSLPEKLATWRFQASIVLPLALGLSLGVVLLFFTATRHLVSARRLADELERAVAAERAAHAAKTSFLASMSHELMTPLNGICGALSLWLMGERDEGRRPLAQAALDSAGRLTRTLQDTLAYVEASSTQRRLPLSPLDLRDSLRSLEAVFIDAGGAPGCRLMRPDDDGRRLPVRSEPAYLADIVQRLMRAAVQVAGTCPAQRPGVVQVRVDEPGQGRRRLVLEVPVAAGTEPRLETALLPFAPSSVTESEGLQGLGLGLEVARLSAQRVQAELLVEIPPGVLRLVLVLPL